ncbi:RNA-directed DNA polymerase from mobile element jockey-like [Elysia marginata]|uniref:RNA-directed DNA polymerase from mobile element jockey-like n=1 Tax=Elysia marginata TaxID=1093978 RepID=A0AAV4F8F1_9GAST|nr:RNA-directed DNA polymerase from mobile element jockey-like [Elysia marginata]
MTKCDHILKRLQKQRIDIALIIEIHLHCKARDTIPGNSMVNRQNHQQCRVTYARQPARMIGLGGSTESNGTQRSCIKIGDTEVHKIFKRPAFNLDSLHVQEVNHAVVVIGDFNNHHSEWGYQDDQ